MNSGRGRLKGETTLGGLFYLSCISRLLDLTLSRAHHELAESDASDVLEGNTSWSGSGRNSCRRSPSVSNCRKTIPFVSPTSAREVRSVEPA